MNSPSHRGRNLSSKPCSSSARAALTSRSGVLSRAMTILTRSVAGWGCACNRQATHNARLDRKINHAGNQLVVETLERLAQAQRKEGAGEFFLEEEGMP